jgi:hypothetical protein
MQPQDKVLACVDQSHFADFVTDAASWAARHMDAPLELLHILDRENEGVIGKDRSGAIGVNAQQNLLSELAERDESRSRGSTLSSRSLVCTRLSPPPTRHAASVGGGTQGRVKGARRGRGGRGAGVAARD